MSTYKALNRSQAFGKPTNALKAIAESARGIRKLLVRTEKSLDQGAWRDVDDAVKLAVTIEAIASHAVDLPAADATSKVGVLELMLEQLDKKIRALASQGGVFG